MTVQQLQECIISLEDILHRHERFKYSYFFTPPPKESQRRVYERKNTRSTNIKYDGIVYNINQKVICSCINVYYSLDITIDSKKKGVRALKKLHKTLVVELSFKG